MKYKISLTVGTLLLIAFVANAETLMIGKNTEIISAFRAFKDIKNIQIQTPEVVQVSMREQIIEIPTFAVLDLTTDEFVANSFDNRKASQAEHVTVSRLMPDGGANYFAISELSDGNSGTFVDFPLVLGSRETTTSLRLTTQQPITASQLNVALKENVAIPDYIQINAIVNGVDTVLLAWKQMNYGMITFPETTASVWSVKFTHSQPLRISEIGFTQRGMKTVNMSALHFLAQPGHDYRVYFNPDHNVIVPTGESSYIDFSKTRTGFDESYARAVMNPAYKIADTDNDGIPDVKDNCPSVSNTDQVDLNNNRIGDACDDFDGDGIPNLRDNCPDLPNSNQIDTDGDRKGDVCDKVESRLTEQYPWIPWVGIGTAGLVLLSLLVLALKTPVHTEQEESIPPVA